jgi:RNA polymerase sigma factor (sigma-70 family)
VDRRPGGVKAAAGVLSLSAETSARLTGTMCGEGVLARPRMARTDRLRSGGVLRHPFPAPSISAGSLDKTEPQRPSLRLRGVDRRPAQATEPDAARTSRFESIFEATQRELLAYALRRTRSHQDAEDAVAETFTVAWRRLHDMPSGDRALPWLYGVARRVIANQRRGQERRLRLHLKLAAEVSPSGASGDRERGRALAALDRLRPDDQEILRLVAWEGLSHAQIGEALGITTNAVAIRLHRARARFEQELRRVDDGEPRKGFRRLRTFGLRKGNVTVEKKREQAR